jgi:hypothetical protein
MNEQQRAVVQQALEALERMERYGDTFLCRSHEQKPYDQVCEAIDALNQLLEQPVQEPVAFKVIKEELCYKSQEDDQSFGMWCPVTPQTDLPFVNGTEFYTTPPAQPAVPLTDEQIDLLINGRGDEDDDDYVEPTGDGFGLTDEDLVKLIRRVEAHHGIGVKP